MAEKKTFVFGSETPVPLPAEKRVANALEHIAYYLDRIDNHLEAIAVHVNAGNANTALVVQSLRGIESVVGRMKP